MQNKGGKESKAKEQVQKTVTTVKQRSNRVGCLPMHFGLWTMVILSFALCYYLIISQTHLDWIVLNVTMHGWSINTSSIAVMAIWTWITHKIYLYCLTLFGEGLDNSNPRAVSAALPANSFLARCYNAHVNMQEAFVTYAICLLIAKTVGVSTQYCDKMALVFIFSRLCYQIVYMLNLSSLRSFFFTLGWMASIALAILAALPRRISIFELKVIIYNLLGLTVTPFN